MRTLLFVMVILVTPLVAAQPAVYTNQTLTIPQGAVVVGDNMAYYENIQLEAAADGSFVAVAAEARDLVAVDSVSVDVQQAPPVQVTVNVAGNKSVPCVNLLTPAVSYADGKFTIALAESTLGPAETCIAMIEPFATTVDLDVEGLSAGTYTVEVNGVTSQFALNTDN